MKPTITIDKDAIRFDRDDGGENYFFKDMFRFSNRDWHWSVMESIYKCYIDCVVQGIEPKEEDEDK